MFRGLAALRTLGDAAGIQESAQRRTFSHGCRPLPMPKREPQWRILIIDGKKAEALGYLSAPDQEAAEDKAVERFGITGERRKRLVARPIAEAK